MASPHPGARPGRLAAGNGLPSLGLLCASIHTGASRDLWAGVLEEAERRGANFLCFPGGRLGAAFAYESQRNRLYDLAGRDSVDGLVVWTTSLEGFAGATEVDELLARLGPLPFVSLHRPVAGAPLVAFDAYRGMSELMAHLLDHHGYERVAFIRGPASHHSAEERFRAYREALAARGIPQRPELVSEPEPWDAGAEAARAFLDERGLLPGRDFRALVGASDLLAFSALQFFQGRGVRVPAELAVAGFNDSLESRLAAPELTTVSIDFRREGAAAISLLLAGLGGEKVPELTALPSRLRIRSSCGCPSPSLALARGYPGGPPLPAAGPGRASLAALLAAELGLEASRILALLDALAGCGSTGSAEGFERFLALLEAELEEESLRGRELEGWQDLLSRLRLRALATPNLGNEARVEGLFHEARILAAEAAARARARRRWAQEGRAELLREAGAALLTARDAEGICRSLADALPGLGIPSAFVALDAEGEASRLLLATGPGGPLPIPRGGIPFPTRLLAPPELLPRSRRYAYVVEPLFLRGRNLGHALLEIGPRDGSVYEELRGYLSGALEGARLFDEAREARRTAEKADEIKTRLLANLSRELCAPLARIAELAALPLAEEGGAALGEALESIRRDAERQLGLIEDLLELSRAEIDELGLELELLDLAPLLAEILPKSAARSIPARLPLLRADRRRLRRLLAAVLETLAASGGEPRLALDVDPPYLILRFSLPGRSDEGLEALFEPFAGAGDGGGLGLGLAVARRIAALHGGSLEPLEGGSLGLRLALPLPSFGGQSARAEEGGRLLVLGPDSEPRPEFAPLSARIGSIAFGSAEEAERILETGRAACLAWDLGAAGSGDWAVVRRLARHHRLVSLPLLLLGAPSGGGQSSPEAAGLSEGQSSPGSLRLEESGLLELLAEAFPRGALGPLLVAASSPRIREELEAAARQRLPGLRFRCLDRAEAAPPVLRSEGGGLLVVELELKGSLELIEALRSEPNFATLPILVLADGALSPGELERLSAQPRLLLQATDIWTEEELGAALESALSGADWLPLHTGALVKRGLVFLSEHFAEPLTRWRLAEAVGASEDYLTRVFSRELGLSPWDCLNRFRVRKAKLLLLETGASAAEIGERVGFHEQAYFSRVFKKIAGLSPQEWRKRARRSEAVEGPRRGKSE